LNDFTYEYLPIRGIDKSTLSFYDVKTKISTDGKPVSMGFKYPNGAYKVRRLDKKDFYSEGDISKAGLFGRDKFAAGSHKYVTITEGELDALSLYQVLRSPVVSVQSAGTGVRDCTVDREWLASFERVYLALDDDAPGRDAAANVAKLFDYNKVYQVKFSPHKDANDLLKSGNGDELKNIWWNAKKYLPETIVSSFSDFKKILEEEQPPSVPYPFRTLNEMTYGIRTSESVLITAQEGVGKTELMHTLEHHLLKETDDAIGAIFLEEPKARHLQAIAGLELRKPAHLPDSGCSNADIYEALQKAVRSDDRLHVYSHFGSDDPSAILDTIRFLVVARGCRFVLLDHINMVVSGLAGDDERRALDFLSTRLEMMVKELDFSLLMVAHVNDEGLTRGSRYISKIADMRIDITRDLTHDDPLERNTTYLTVSKNRFSGKTGSAGKLIFDPLTYTFSEQRGYADESHGSQDHSRTPELVV
jgi:twinkle protein